MTTIEQIIDLIRASNRGIHSLDIDECALLIENYASCAAAAASVKATTDAHNRAIAAFDACARNTLNQDIA